MSYVCKFKSVHKRVLGYFGYTLFEAQKLPEGDEAELPCIDGDPDDEIELIGYWD